MEGKGNLEQRGTVGNGPLVEGGAVGSVEITGTHGHVQKAPVR